MKTSEITLEQLLPMIDSYFECELSDREELRLRELVAATPLSHPAIDEVKALMGFRRPLKQDILSQHNNENRVSFRKLIVPIIGVAALIAVVVSFMSRPSVKGMDSHCIAYVNGHMVTDEEAVMRQIFSDMRVFSDCAGNVSGAAREDLDDIYPILDGYQTLSF